MILKIWKPQERLWHIIDKIKEVLIKDQNVEKANNPDKEKQVDFMREGTVGAGAWRTLMVHGKGFGYLCNDKGDTIEKIG